MRFFYPRYCTCLVYLGTNLRAFLHLSLPFPHVGHVPKLSKLLLLGLEKRAIAWIDPKSCLQAENLSVIFSKEFLMQRPMLTPSTSISFNSYSAQEGKLIRHFPTVNLQKTSQSALITMC